MTEKQTSNLIHAVEITEEARFDYEECLFDCRASRTWDDCLIEVCGEAGRQAAENMREAKKGLYKAKHALTKYLRETERKYCETIDELQANTEAAQKAVGRVNKRYQPLHTKTFAVFDNELAEPPLRKINAREIASYCADYITETDRRGRLNEYTAYLRVEYYDDRLKAELVFFLTRGRRMGNMQFWKLCHIRADDEFTAELEDSGAIREFVKDKLPELTDEITTDFVVADRVRRVLRETEKTTFAGVLEETLNEFEFENDKRMATAILLAKKHLRVGWDERLIRRA